MTPARVSYIAAAFGLLLAQQNPSFRTGVDLLTIEATVLDAGGKPVGDLGSGDFTVTIDGRPRKVLFSDFHGGPSAPSPAASTAAAALSTPSAAARPDGRIVVFVVDRDSLASGNEMAMLETANTVLDSLGPGDAVGLLGIPVGSVELTRDHDRVRKVLSMMTGTRPRQVTYRDRSITWDEALAYERNDGRVIAEVVERECYQIPVDPGGMRNQCPPDLVTQARELLQAGRAHVQATTSTLESLAERLSPLRGPKHIIMMSGGLQFGQDLLPRFNSFARKAIDAQIVLYAVHLDQPGSDTTDRKPVASAFGGRDTTQGLTALTGMTGGTFFSAVGKAVGVFDRLKTAINNYYILGLESAPDDEAGSARSVKVTVARAGLSVRARDRIAIRPGTIGTAALDRLTTLLDQPTDVGDLIIGASTYSTRGTEESTLRVLIASEIGADRSRLPVDWGYVVLNEGNVVSTGRQRFEAASQGPWVATASAKLLPGQYRLRVAATDAGGRAGVADVPLAVGLRVAGEMQMSDVIVGVAEAGRLQPRDRISQGVPLSALIEVMSANAGRLQASRAVIEVIPDGVAEPVKRFLMAARTGASDAILLNAAEIDTAALPPGRYTAAVTVLVDNQPVGRVSRGFQIE